jgi:hypothetical protein
MAENPLRSAHPPLGPEGRRRTRRPHHHTHQCQNIGRYFPLIQSRDCLIAVSSSVAYQKSVELDDSERVFGEKSAASDAEFAAISSAPYIALVRLYNRGVGSVHVFETKP